MVALVKQLSKQLALAQDPAEVTGRTTLTNIKDIEKTPVEELTVPPQSELESS